MSSFKLSDSHEYKQIKERRKVVNSLLGNAIPPPMPSVCVAATAVVNQFLKPFSSQSSSMFSSDEEKEFAAKVRTIYNLVARSETLDNKISQMNARLMKNIYDIHAVSNFSFAECLFQFDCELPDIKKYRQGGSPTEDSKMKTARISRRKAEDCFRNGQADEAIRIFKEAEEKFDFDYTVCYQMGLLYFFEKADYTEAMNYFRKAMKCAQNKCRQIFVNSLVFIGLLTRIAAVLTRDGSLYSEAYEAVSQGYKLDESCNFALYALAQCSASMKDHSGYVGETAGLIRELIKRDRFFALQIISDYAFAPFVNEIEKIYGEIVKDMNNSGIDLFKQIDESFEKMSQVTKYVSVPAKIAALRNEYNSVLNTFNSNKNYFDMSEIIITCKETLKALQEIFQEVAKNRVYYELREALEKMTVDYQKEADEAALPYRKLEEEYKNARTALDGIHKSYPLAHPAHDAEEAQKHAGETAWYQTRGFVIINIVSGFLTSILFISVIISSYVAMQIEITWLTYILCIGVLSFIPIYGRLCGELFYIYVEKRRRHLDDEVNRLGSNLSSKKPNHEENQNKIRDKYIKAIMEKHKVPASLADKMFECGMKGNFEQLRVILQANPSCK